MRSTLRLGAQYEGPQPPDWSDSRFVIFSCSGMFGQWERRVYPDSLFADGLRGSKNPKTEKDGFIATGFRHITDGLLPKRMGLGSEKTGLGNSAYFFF